MLSPVVLTGAAFEFSDGRLLFENLSLSLESSVTALVGPNGIGKSTLARLIAGELDPSQGQIRRRTPVFYLPQRATPPEVSVAKYLGHLATTPFRRDLLERIAPETACVDLSGGEWTRVRLAKLDTGGFLILDEPTNDLDQRGRAAFADFLRSHRAGALLISHDREALGLCSRILELSSQGLMRFSGDWSDFEAARNLERTRLQKELDQAKRERERTKEARIQKMHAQAKSNRNGQRRAQAGGLPKILLGARKRRSQVTTGQVDRATTRDAEEKVREAHAAYARLKESPVMYAGIDGQAIAAQKVIAEARGFNIKFADWLYSQDLNFTWKGNLRLALKGRNGSGKTTLLNAVLGAPFASRGELRRGNLRTLYIDQRCSSLDDSLSILENVRSSANLEQSQARGELAKFLFTKDEVFQRAANLSGGERLRAALARGLLAVQKPELLILDEPTNNLDGASVDFVTGLVRAFKGAVIVISHDEAFLQNARISAALELAELLPRRQSEQ